MGLSTPFTVTVPVNFGSSLLSFEHEVNMALIITTAARAKRVFAALAKIVFVVIYILILNGLSCLSNVLFHYLATVYDVDAVGQVFQFAVKMHALKGVDAAFILRHIGF